MDPTKQLIKLDVKNAYQSFNYDLLDTLDFPQSVAQFIETRQLVFKYDIYKLHSGLIIGSSIDQAVFWRVMDVVCDKLRQKFPNFSYIDHYVDDFFVVTPRNVDSKIVEEALQEILTEFHFTLNTDKTKVLL